MLYITLTGKCLYLGIVILAWVFSIVEHLVDWPKMNLYYWPISILIGLFGAVTYETQWVSSIAPCRNYRQATTKKVLQYWYQNVSHPTMKKFPKLRGGTAESVLKFFLKFYDFLSDGDIGEGSNSDLHTSHRLHQVKLFNLLCPFGQFWPSLLLFGHFGILSLFDLFGLW